MLLKHMLELRLMQDIEDCNMSQEENPLNIIFAPGCFDNFEGTQEELDELMAEIIKSFESGELLEQSTPVSVDELMEELSEDELNDLLGRFNTPTRNLQ